MIGMLLVPMDCSNGERPMPRLKEMRLGMTANMFFKTPTSLPTIALLIESESMSAAGGMSCRFPT